MLKFKDYDSVKESTDQDKMAIAKKHSTAELESIKTKIKAFIKYIGDEIGGPDWMSREYNMDQLEKAERELKIIERELSTR